jgi:hypothetical protein
MAVSGWSMAGHKPWAAQRRSPDSEIGLAEARNRLADFKIVILLQ